MGISSIGNTLKPKKPRKAKLNEMITSIYLLMWQFAVNNALFILNFIMVGNSKFLVDYYDFFSGILVSFTKHFQSICLV